MKKLLLLVLTGALSVPAFADVGDRLLELDTFRVTDQIHVTLPRVLHADGAVCQTYVASAARGAAGSVVVDFADVCGPGAKRANPMLSLLTGDDAKASEDLLPANLEALVAVTVDGLTHQEPRLAAAK